MRFKIKGKSEKTMTIEDAVKNHLILGVGGSSRSLFVYDLYKEEYRCLCLFGQLYGTVSCDYILEGNIDISRAFNSLKEAAIWKAES